MQNRKESLYPKDWFRKGDEDLLAAGALMITGNVGIAAFHLQQALEKYLKGYLLSRNWKLRRIHDLEELLDDAIKLKPSFETYRPLCQTVTEYYIEDRYPFNISSEFKKDELEKVISEAKKFIAEILEEIKHEA